ncbi:hypothetical protein COLO4_36901 [Corchorus olitorius]|uniref:Uncharacterized protein n=1 Tax=Corchorus olitorius TaxID=93759 RepID=A0A1R3G4G9_9ROSI|nr:hypothetical protein COLO4_36901 [Corchorus olitorius]
MPSRRAPGRGRGRWRPPLQRLPHRLPEDAEEESFVHSSPTNENLNVDPPPPPQWQHVPPPPCSPYEAFMDWRQRFETQIPQYEAAQPPVSQGQYVPPPPPVYGELQSSISSLITDMTRTVPYSHLTQASRGGRNFNTGRYTTAAHIASGRETSGSGFNTRDRVQTRLYTMTREAAQDNPNSIMGIDCPNALWGKLVKD